MTGRTRVHMLAVIERSSGSGCVMANNGGQLRALTGEWSYEQTSVFQMKEFPEPFAPTNRNTLRRVG